MTDSNLSRLSVLIKELNQTNSMTDKIAALKHFGDCQQLLKYVYDTNLYQYGVTSDNVRKLRDSQAIANIISTENFHNDTIISLLNDLNNRSITGHRAIAAIVKFISNNAEFEDLILNIIDRNIQVRIGAPVINKVFPGLISEFNVSLGVSLSDYDPDRTKLDFSKQQFYASRKLDGVRTVALIDANGNITIKSRSGKEYLTLDLIKEQLKTLNLRNVVIDGECCLLNPDGTDNFQGMMKEIRKKNHTVQNAAYRCFDILSLNDFYRGTTTTKFSDRIENLRNTIAGKLPNVDMIEQRLITSWDDVDNFQKEALDNDWEGLVLRKNDIYKGKRSNDLIKVKQFNECEVVIKNIEVGPFRVINYRPDGSSYEATEQVVTNLIAEYEGYPLSIGSGLSLESRRLFKAQPSLIVGKTVTVKYFETTKNENGGLSLRFPILKTIHGNERLS